MKKLKIVLGYLNIPRLLPHIFLYLRNSELHKSDIEKNILFRDKSMFINLVCLLVFNKYFRTLFYHRIGRVRHLIKFLCPDNKTLFFISPDTIIGEGMQCGHPFSTVVNAASIGRNFCVYQNVTIGAGGGGG